MQLQEVAIRSYNSVTVEVHTQNQTTVTWFQTFSSTKPPKVLDSPSNKCLNHAYMLGCFNYYISELPQEYKYSLLSVFAVRDTKAKITL